MLACMAVIRGSVIHLVVIISPVHVMQAGAHFAMLPTTVVRECIASRLWAAKDKDSLLAMMQTSRELRLVVSSFISEAEVENVASDMQTFPRHATIRTLDLWMQPAKAADWLQDYVGSDPDAAGRLQLLEKVKFSMGDVLAGTWVGHPHPEDGPALLDVIAQLCPNVRSLLLYLSEANAVNLPLLRSLGTHMPHLTELCLDRGEDGQFIDDSKGSMDWAACLPPCLAKFSMPNSCLTRELIRQLVRMPLLLEVEAYGLEEFPTGEIINEDPVEMETCAWQMLRYGLSAVRSRRTGDLE